jgi:hypothetical protein
MHSGLVDRVQVLAARLGRPGAQHELAALALAHLSGLVRSLERLARSSGHGPAS